MFRRLNRTATGIAKSASCRRLSTNASSGSGLKTYLLEFHFVANMIERRVPHRAAHLAYANDFVKRNILIAGGALLPEAERGVLLFKAENPKVVEDYAKGDPYVTEGLVTKYTVKEWAVAVGKV